MAKIVDPDALSQEKLTGASVPSGTTEVSFHVENRLIYLNDVGTLDNADGVTLQAVYSFCKEEWKNDVDLIKLPFPFEAITEVKYDLFNGWDFADQATKNRIRDGGWSLLDGTVPAEQYFGFITLGTMVDDLADTAYYQQSVAGAAVDAVFTGPVNEPVKVFGDVTHGSVDNRSVFNSFLREQGKTYSAATLAEQAVFAIDYTVYKLPLANSTDPKITNADSVVQTAATFLGTETQALLTDGVSAADSTTFTSAGSTFTGLEGQLIVIPTTDAANVGRYEIVTVNSATEVVLNRAMPATSSVNEFTVNQKGMTVSYLDGTGFTTVADTTYALDDVVQEDNGAASRWYICTGAGTVTGSTGAAQATWGGTATWAAYAGEREIGTGLYYPYNVIVDGTSELAEQIYEFTQWRNRLAENINDQTATGSGTSVIAGQTAKQLLSFLGDTLITGEGVYIDNFNSNDTNRIEFTDLSGTTQTFPFVAAGVVNFNANLVNDEDAVYWMFFATDYGTTNALIVNNNAGTPITGSVPGVSVGFDFDYDGNTQGGRTPGTDAEVVIVAIGLETAQFVSINATITRAVGQNFSLVSNLERNYSNPV